MSSLRENWTRDANGEYVRWNEPPYREPGSGLLRLVLDGEDPARLPMAVHQQRILEYYALERRAMRQQVIHRKRTGLSNDSGA